MGQDDAVEGDRAHALGGVVVAFLGGGQQRVQHLDGCLEHLHEFHHALVGAVQAAAEAVGIRVVLAVVLQHADVDLAHQCRDVLVVVVPGLGLGHGHLVQYGGVFLHHPELADVTAVFVQALDRPGRHDGLEVARRNAVFLLENGAILLRVEEPEGGFIHGRALDGVEGHLLHEVLELLREGGLAATNGAQQVEDLFLLFQALGCVAEVGNDVLDGLLHAIELGEFRVSLDDLVGKDAGEAWIQGGVDELGFADGEQHALGGGGVRGGILLADAEVFLEAHFLFLGCLVTVLIALQYAHAWPPCCDLGEGARAERWPHWAPEVSVHHASSPSGFCLQLWMSRLGLRV